jgi:hypothetical protein
MSNEIYYALSHTQSGSALVANRRFTRRCCNRIDLVQDHLLHNG